MIMAIKLDVWNAALDELGHPPLADTGENIEAARVITRRWNGVVEDCMNEAFWNFLTQDARIYADTGFTAEFGYAKKFDKPTDWVRTAALSEDEHYSFPHLYYSDNGDHWRAENEPIYVKYVSNDTGLTQLSRWPAAFSAYVEMELAARICMRITQNASMKEDVEKERDKEKKKAKNIDAMDEAQPKFPPPSSWTTSRWGATGRRDRGSRGSLIG